MNDRSRDSLANARALAAEVLTGTPAKGQTERQLLEAVERVQRLPHNPKDTTFVLELVASYLRQQVKR